MGEVRSPQELAERVAEVVSSGKVDTLTLPYATQRRIILEAVAYGSFLRDVEGRVEGAADVPLLTPALASGGGGRGGRGQ